MDASAMMSDVGMRQARPMEVLSRHKRGSGADERGGDGRERKWFFLGAWRDYLLETHTRNIFNALEE